MKRITGFDVVDYIRLIPDRHTRTAFLVDLAQHAFKYGQLTARQCEVFRKIQREIHVSDYADKLWDSYIDEV